MHLLNEQIMQPYQRPGSVLADLGEVQLCFETGSKIQSTNARDTDPNPFPLTISHHFQCVLDHTHTCIHVASITAIT